MSFLNKTGLSRLWAYIVAQLNTKVDKVDGKGLSTNDFTDEEKNKLASIDDGAGNVVVDDALSDTSTNPVQNKIINEEISNLHTLIGDTSISEQISTALDSSKADWNQTEETAADYIKNKPLIATDADTLDFLSEISYVTPVANADGSIYANEQGQVYTI